MVQHQAGHPNAALIRQAIDGFNRGQPAAFMDALAENVVFEIPGDSPVAGTYRGKAELGRFFGHLAQLSEAPPHVELLHLLTGGDEHVVAIWMAHGARKGWEYGGIAGYIFRVQRGQIVEARNLQEDQEEIDRFWSA